MFENIVFQGEFEQLVFKSIREKAGHVVPMQNRESGYFEVNKYEAFDREDLIPSLVKLVGKVNRRGRDKCKSELREWIRKNGFLTVSDHTAHENGQSIDDFWSAAEEISSLWQMYSEAVNRDIPAIEKYLKIDVEALTEDEKDNEIFLWGEGSDGRVVIKSPLPKLDGGAFGVQLADIKNDWLGPYQLAILHHVAEMVTYNAGNVHFHYRNLIKQPGLESETDLFKIEAIIKPSTLIQALYLQFMQKLTEKRKVCPACWKSFPVKRKDQIYCCPGCKSTHNSRIQRGGVNNGK